MSKPVYERSKPNMNIAVVGSHGHGKTTLTAALTQAQAERGLGQAKTHAELDSAPEERAGKRSVHVSIVECETATRHYTLCDLPGHLEYVENFISGGSGCDGAIIVVRADEPIGSELVQQLYLVRQFGIPRPVVYLSHSDGLDDGRREAIERELEALLERFDFGSEIVIVDGGRSPVNEVLEVFDRYELWRDDRLPLFLPIAKVFELEGVGTVVTGRIERGQVQVGDPLAVLGLGVDQECTVKGLEIFGRVPERGVAGDILGILLEGVEAGAVQRGQLLCAPGSYSTERKFEAEVYTLTEAEGGRHTPYFKGFQPVLWFRTTQVTAADLQLPEGIEMVQPGSSQVLHLTLSKPTILDRGMRFIMREGHQTIAVGTVTAIFD